MLAEVALADVARTDAGADEAEVVGQFGELVRLVAAWGVVVAGGLGAFAGVAAAEGGDAVVAHGGFIWGVGFGGGLLFCFSSMLYWCWRKVLFVGSIS